MSKPILLVVVNLTALLAASASATPLAGQPRRYAIVVANNESDDDTTPALSFADDDGARYFELFRAAGAEVTLLAVLDPAAQRRYPEALAVALPPRKAELAAAVESTFAKIQADRARGRETHFYFVYAGHGNVGPNREGYLELLDGQFRRSELYRGVLARSPATFNHLILDACHAYFVVHKRGGGSDRQGDFRAAVSDFLRAEELAAYPNTGVLLAASSESETHEWSQWESGIFSHELHSALLGAADVDGNHAITYAEAAAFVEAANAAVDMPRARLRVFSRPPPAKMDVPLFDTSVFVGVSSIVVDLEHAGRYHVEDARGVRIADLHSSREQAVALGLVGKAPFYLRALNREAQIPDRPRVEVRELRFEQVGEVSRGGVETTFRRHLFEVAFGQGFYQGMLSMHEAHLPVAVESAGKVPLSPPPRRGHLHLWAAGSFAAAVLSGAAGGVTYYYASQAHDRYQKATTSQDAARWHSSTEDRLLGARILFCAAGAAAVTGVTLLILDQVWRDRSVATVPIVIAAEKPAGGIALFGQW
jgi:hypothetical protein